MKIIIKKKLSLLEEALRTSEEAKQKEDGIFKEQLIKAIIASEQEKNPNKKSELASIEEKAVLIMNNILQLVPEEYEYYIDDESRETRKYTLSDTEKLISHRWIRRIVLRYKENNLIERLAEQEVGGFLKSSYKKALSRFMMSKKEAKEKDINRINDLYDLEVIGDNAFFEWAQKQKEKERDKELARNPTEKIEELISPEPHWEILIPHDLKGAIFLGKICVSHWCTATKNEFSNAFSTYYKENDPIFVVKHKTQKETAEIRDPSNPEGVRKVQVPLMYQVHFGRIQFKDRKNEPVDEKTRELLYFLIKNSKTKDGQNVWWKYPIILRATTVFPHLDTVKEHFQRFSKLWL